MRCPTCQGEMGVLFSSYFCPKDCDRPRCDMPPAGWTCKRGRGHDGPCAALPTMPAQHRDIEFLDFDLIVGPVIPPSTPVKLYVKVPKDRPPTEFRWEIQTYGTEAFFPRGRRR